MMDESNIEFFGKVKSSKLTSLAEDINKERSEIIAEREYWEKYGANR